VIVEAVQGEGGTGKPRVSAGDELERGPLLLDDAVATIGAPSVAAQPAGGRRH